MDSSVTEQLKDIIASKLSIDASTVTTESRFVEDLNADSLDLADLVMSIEDTFSVTFEDADTEQFKTVGDVVKVIEQKKS